MSQYTLVELQVGDAERIDHRELEQHVPQEHRCDRGPNGFKREDTIRYAKEKNLKAFALLDGASNVGLVLVEDAPFKGCRVRGLQVPPTFAAIVAVTNGLRVVGGYTHGWGEVSNKDLRDVIETVPGVAIDGMRVEFIL